MGVGSKGIIFGTNVPLKFEVPWGTKANVSDCGNVWKWLVLEDLLEFGGC